MVGNIGQRNDKSQKDEVHVIVNVDLQCNNKINTKLRAKVDTGAKGTILPMRFYRQMYPNSVGADGNPRLGELKKTNTILTAYGGSRLKQHGTLRIPYEYQGKEIRAVFYVTEAQGPAILGLPTVLELELVTEHRGKESDRRNQEKEDQSSIRNTLDVIKNKDDLMFKYPDCFNGIGTFDGRYHIIIDPTVSPVIHPPRRVPIALKDDIKEELDEMVSKGIIAKVKEREPTAYVNSLVYRRKPNGKLRICLDSKDLNRAIQREHHVIATLEEIFPKLSGAKIFSIIDAKCGYWNVQLDEESTYLTTFNSAFGRYRFLRMPFGNKCLKTYSNPRSTKHSRGVKELSELQMTSSLQGNLRKSMIADCMKYWADAEALG